MDTSTKVVGVVTEKEVDNSGKRWFQRGFTSNRHYQGWLHFNDLVDESHSYDDVYRDPFSGRTIHLMGETDVDSLDEDDEGSQFLNGKNE